MITLAIGTLIVHEGISMIVTPSENNEPSCEGCVFNDNKIGYGIHFSCRNIKWGCTPYQRKDKIHVIFKQQKVI